jgi:chloride channel protein, CIC family
MASELPGLGLTPAVAVGIGAAVVSVLRLPLSAVVLGVLLTLQAGPGAAPLVIVGVISAYLTTVALDARVASEGVPPLEPAPTTVAPTARAGR